MDISPTSDGLFTRDYIDGYNQKLYYRLIPYTFNMVLALLIAGRAQQARSALKPIKGLFGLIIFTALSIVLEGVAVQLGSYALKNTHYERAYTSEAQRQVQNFFFILPLTTITLPYLWTQLCITKAAGLKGARRWVVSLFVVQLLAGLTQIIALMALDRSTTYSSWVILRGMNRGMHVVLFFVALASILLSLIERRKCRLGRAFLNVHLLSFIFFSSIFTTYIVYDWAYIGFLEYGWIWPFFCISLARTILLFMLVEGAVKFGRELSADPSQDGLAQPQVASADMSWQSPPAHQWSGRGWVEAPDAAAQRQDLRYQHAPMAPPQYQYTASGHLQQMPTDKNAHVSRTGEVMGDARYPNELQSAYIQRK